MSTNEADNGPGGPELVCTSGAVERLRTLLQESGDAHRKLRIQAEGPANDPTYTLSLEDAAAADDVELDFAVIAVVLDPESHRRLRGHEVDHRDDGDGEHFVIRRAG